MAISLIGTPTEGSGNNPASGDWTLSTGWQVGDLLLVFWYARSGSITITEPATITEKLDTNAGNNDFGRLFVGYRYLQSGDSTFTWTKSGGAAGDSIVWGAMVLRGGPTSGDPFEAASAAQGNLNTQSVDPPGVTTLTNNAWVLTVIGGDDDAQGAGELTPPSGYTGRFYVEDLAGSDACLAVASIEKASAGSEDPGVWGNFNTAGTDSIAWTASVPPGGTTLSPTGLSRTRALGSPGVNPTLVLSALLRTRALGAPTVTAGSPATLLPASLVRTRALGSLLVNPTLAAASLVRTRALGTLAVQNTLRAPSLERVRALGVPSVSPQVLVGSLVRARALGSPTIVLPPAGGQRVQFFIGQPE